MRIFNADGSEDEMCGNGLRCLVKFVVDLGLARENPLRVETGAGTLVAQWESSEKSEGVAKVRVDMG